MEHCRGRLVRLLQGSIQAGEIHDVEGLDLPGALGEGPALDRLFDRVPGYRGLDKTSAGRRGASAPLSTKAPAALTCASKSGRSDIDPGRQGQRAFARGSTSTRSPGSGRSVLMRPPGRAELGQAALDALDEYVQVG
jgi:hypothetical protein